MTCILLDTFCRGLGCRHCSGYRRGLVRLVFPALISVSFTALDVFGMQIFVSVCVAAGVQDGGGPLADSIEEFPKVLRRLPESVSETSADGSQKPEARVALPDFVPRTDRWRSVFPEWKRYQPRQSLSDQPYESRQWWDSYNQNILKGDYPIIGEETFLNIRASNQFLYERREVPARSWDRGSSAVPGANQGMGDPHQSFFSDSLRLQFSVFHGDAAFKPVDWQVRVTPVLNVNRLQANELSVVSADPENGRVREQGDIAFEEWFGEWKLADLSTDYDFVSVRAGSQLFVSDFRGFLFADTNRAVRIFGTGQANRQQFNLAVFDQAEKDTNSFLNTMRDRHQNTLIGNWYVQDFIVPGYTAQVSFHYNDDQSDLQNDDNGFVVRPAPTGVSVPHDVHAYYFGFSGDGHIGVVNISHAFYHVEGRDGFNAIQGQSSAIRADMAALELSIDRDWVRFRTSGLFASGDDDMNDGVASGFDSITDNPNFAGGQFSFWQRQQIRLQGVNLVQRESLYPNLRPGKFQGQSNFVNPGLRLLNGGMDFELTPKLRTVTNANFLWFDQTESLQRVAARSSVARRIGTDLSLGIEYRPLLNDNVILTSGLAALIPGRGLMDLYGTDPQSGSVETDPNSVETLHGMFVDLLLTY